jgi:AcrR family transcriptional regulator
MKLEKMADKINRRDQIVDAASHLFIGQGYTATSVRQIAEAVGCTEAALYYHFKDGKRELFQAVVEANLPDFLGMLDQCENASSLHELILQVSRNVARAGRLRIQKMQWLLREFSLLSDEERSFLHKNQLAFYDKLAGLIGGFVDDPVEASELAWTVASALFGYMSLFVVLDLQSLVDFSADRLAVILANVLAQGR